jgi:hypothetical protein
MAEKDADPKALAKAARDARLAEALRANLRRRKAAGKPAKSATPAPPEPKS